MSRPQTGWTNASLGSGYASPRHLCASCRRYVLEQRRDHHSLVFRIWDIATKSFLPKAFRDVDVAARYADMLEAKVKGGGK